MIEPSDINAQDEMDERLKRLADSLLKKRDDAIEARSSSGIERSWREAQRAFDGVDATVGKTDMMDFATGDSWVSSQGSQGAQPRRSRVIVNIIRGKCETAEGRFSEIQFPTDDKNWGLLNTKVPEASAPVPQPGLMAQAMPQTQPGMQGQPPQQAGQPPDPVQAKKDDLEKRRAAMEEEIDDQLEECSFNGECRKVARSAIRLGTGVLKGPNVVKSVRRAWIEQSDGMNSVHVLQSVENFKPASKCVDIWNIYPDRNCGNDAKRGAYIWERDHILPREVRNLVGVPGYNERELAKVLAEEPVRTVVQVDKGNNHQTQTTRIDKGAPYEIWEYHGDIDREDMLAMGCECDDSMGAMVSACVVFINDRPVKAERNLLDTGELPYDFFQWVQSGDDTPWGIGEPHKIIWQQRIITAAWRAMMDNAGDSSGSMLIMSRDVVPEDGVWEVTGKKIWIDDSEDGDVRKAFTQFQINSNQVELQNIIQLALKFTDLESGTPALAQGEKGSSPETLGGMQMLMAAADTTRRRQVKEWDDKITRPHISRYYHWNMQYNKKQEIKGDFEIDARGTSVLLVRDQTAQSLMQILSLRQDPEVNIQVDWGKAIRQLFQSRHLDVLKPDSEVEEARKKMEAQPPQVAPQVQVAQIRAQSLVQVEQIQSKEEADHAAANASLEMAKQRFDAAESDKDRQLKLVIQQSSEHIQQMKQSGASEQTIQTLKTELAETVMKLNTQKQLSQESINHQRDIATAGHMVDLHKSQVLQPPTEPYGRAPTGEAFQA